MADSGHLIGAAHPDSNIAADQAGGRPETAGVTAEAGTGDLLERLSSHRILGGAPRQELRWLAAHGHLRRHEAGDIVSSPETPVEGMFVLLSGRLSIHVVRGATLHKVAEWQAGDVTGLLPYSRLVTPPGETIVEEAVEMLVLPRDLLPAMIRECHELTSILVHVMLDRTRFFNSTQLHDEKLRSLGKLAAGLAHELNNPAAAITRSAKTLHEAVAAAETAARVLGEGGLTPSELEAVGRLRQECVATPVRQVRSPIEEAEREEVIARWLDRRGIDGGAAYVVAQSPVALEALDRLAASVRADILERAVRWVAADCSVRGLATEIEQAGTRISDLVTAVRGFTQVDVSAAPQAVDLAEGLTQTLAVLRGKARGKAIRMEITVEDGLPRVRGVAAELNQVWANLIDNALDAAPQSGRVEVTAGRQKAQVVVRVIDDGPGIAPENLDRIFDPFFTTKDVGKGTGLGLDIVRRLVERHNGDVEVRSRPGRTEFIVSLPVADLHARGGGA